MFIFNVSALHEDRIAKASIEMKERYTGKHDEWSYHKVWMIDEATTIGFRSHA